MFIVTGANGFIGSVLVQDLNQQGIEDILCVDPISISERSEPLKNKKFIRLDHSDQFLKDLQDGAYHNKITSIFHMGACSSTTEMDEAYLKKNNTQYSQILFNYCFQEQIPLIYASSGATYGDGSNGFDDETDPKSLTPLNPYGWSKLNFDIWALEQKDAPPLWYGLKFFNVYGPNEYHKDSMSSLVFKAFHQILETNELKLFKSHREDYKDGQQLRDFIYVKDISRWTLELFQQKKLTSGIYNMGTGKARSWLDLATAVFRSLNKELKINWIDMPENIRNQYQYFTEAKMQKAFSQGLSAPEWSLEKGIQDYIENYLSSKKSIY